ncbi:MAG: helix-turn-helix domain-containing protein [Dehalococcoidia bacterium]|nr:helix-turn-helix domain-containing protein [Dehalococcoidia bacterium]
MSQGSAKATKQTRSTTVQSVVRAFNVLQAFFEEGTDLSVTEVATRINLAPATVHRLLATLVMSGWIEQDRRSLRYELSAKVLARSAMALASSRLLRDSQQFLVQLSEATGLNSFLTAPIPQGSVLLAKQQGRLGPAAEFQVGKVHPLHASATGKLFLAYLPYTEWWDGYGRGGELGRLTANTIVDPIRLRRELEAIRERGYSVDHDELHDSYRSIAVPVRNAHADVIAALSCSGWASELPEDFEQMLLHELVPAARELSSSLDDYLISKSS